MLNAKSQLNKYALLLEDAQTEIRLLIKKAFLSEEPLYYTEAKLIKLINSTIKEIKIDRLKQDAYRSLLNFANLQKRIWQELEIAPFVVAFLGSQASKGFPSVNSLSTVNKAVESQIKGSYSYRSFDKGVPLQNYYKDVWEKKIKPTLDRLCETVALDPNDFTGRNSLRNLAEMEVRYKDRQDNIDSLKSQGVKVVICSAHEDCSERCFPWQKQRFFSLDGSYGEIDGHKYIPLEVATDIYYTTKAGRRYKNGLLGFNCRHKLEKYNGQLTPTVSAKTRAIEYGITKKQRELERAVRKKKTEMLMLKGINKDGYIKAKEQAKMLTQRYEEFSRRNNRAYYPMRTNI